MRTHRVGPRNRVVGEVHGEHVDAHPDTRVRPAHLQFAVEVDQPSTSRATRQRSLPLENTPRNAKLEHRQRPTSSCPPRCSSGTRDGHGPPAPLAAITVQWRGGDRWAILLRPNWSSAQVWCGRGWWEYEPCLRPARPKFSLARATAVPNAEDRRPTGGGRFVTARGTGDIVARLRDQCCRLGHDDHGHANCWLFGRAAAEIERLREETTTLRVWVTHHTTPPPVRCRPVPGALMPIRPENKEPLPSRLAGHQRQHSIRPRWRTVQMRRTLRRPITPPDTGRCRAVAVAPPGHAGRS